MKKAISKILSVLFLSLFMSGLVLSQTVTDYDGNEYNTVIIGSQVWLKENLKSLHYSDGSEISDVAAYNSLDSLAGIYGLLYTWDAAMNGSTEPASQGVCPCNWHLPTSEEWIELENYLGGPSVAGGKMKDTTEGQWQNPNTGADNSSGFSGLPGGEFDANQGIFQLIHQYAVFWTSTSVSALKARERYLAYNNGASNTYDWYKTLKYSIRCIKNTTSDTKGTGYNPAPKKFQLFQNYPNPFNPGTKIKYSVPQWSKVQIKVIDVLGNKIETLVDGEKPAGTYEVSWNASVLPSGVYICQLRAVDPSTGSGQVFVQTKKMILLK